MLHPALLEGAEADDLLLSVSHAHIAVDAAEVDLVLLKGVQIWQVGENGLARPPEYRCHSLWFSRSRPTNLDAASTQAHDCMTFGLFAGIALTNFQGSAGGVRVPSEARRAAMASAAPYQVIPI